MIFTSLSLQCRQKRNLNFNAPFLYIFFIFSIKKIIISVFGIPSVKILNGNIYDIEKSIKMNADFNKLLSFRQSKLDHQIVNVCQLYMLLWATYLRYMYIVSEQGLSEKIVDYASSCIIKTLKLWHTTCNIYVLPRIDMENITQNRLF